MTPLAVLLIILRLLIEHQLHFTGSYALPSETKGGGSRISCVIRILYAYFCISRRLEGNPFKLFQGFSLDLSVYSTAPT